MLLMGTFLKTCAVTLPKKQQHCIRPKLHFNITTKILLYEKSIKIEQS